MTRSSRNIVLRLIQINDVYEPGVLDPTRQPGGLPRVAALAKKMSADGVPQFLIHSGDAYSPSVFNRLQWQGAPLAGRHMNEILNAMNIAMAVPGNHEFDLSPEELHARFQESRFPWLNTNLRDAATDALLPGTQPTAVLQAATVRVGFFGVSIGSGKPSVRVGDVNQAAHDAVQSLRGQQVDSIVAITHLMRQQDESLARSIPGIDLIAGGHEHEGMLFQCNGITVAKAQSNARNLVVHELHWESHGALQWRSRFQDLPVTEPEDAAIAAMAQRWFSLLTQDLTRQGIDARRTVYSTSEALDGLDGSVRIASTNLSRLILEGLQTMAAPQAGGVDFTILSGGVIRLDDVIPPGPVTEYDLLRIFPFPERLMAVKLPGALVARLLKREFSFQRLSCYHAHGATMDDSAPTVGGAAVDPNRGYTVAVTDHLYRRLQSEAPLASAVDCGDLRELLGRFLACRSSR